MNTHPTELLATAEKRAWLASIFRDQSGDFTDADKIKALEADTRLALIEETRPASPANGIKNTEHAPKYDPNRLFRKGDKVRLCEYNGRAPFDNENFEQEEAGQLYIIAEDEDNENAYSLHVWKLEDMEREPDDGERPWFAFPLMFMELVTPVEEPYSVVRPENYKCVRIMVGKRIHSSIPFDEDECVCLTLEQALTAAEAERDRLNAEYRKEREIRNEIIEIDKALNKEILNHADAFLTRKEQE